MQQPQPLPVRHLSDKSWEVLIIENEQWLSCDNEDDARTIAKAPVYEHEALGCTKTGAAFASELERLAEALEKYGMRFGSGFFRDSAEKARNMHE